MKKTLLSFLIMMSLLLVGCTAAEKSKYGTDVGELPPALIMAGQNFFANTMSIDELPVDYEYMGDLTDEEANDTGLAGCKYYANKYISSFDEFYVYQECGTPIGENAAENTQRQWSYVKWVREGFERN